MKDASGVFVYIGKAKSLKNRVPSYFRAAAANDTRILGWIGKVVDFDFIVVDNELEALTLECSLIKHHAPRYNVLLRDDKGFSYIHISEEEFPRISVKLQKSESGTFIGPFMSSFAAKSLVAQVNEVFSLPLCGGKYPKKPCLNFHIKKCMGVCRGNITIEEYAKIIDDAKSFIKSGKSKAIENLRTKMDAAAEAMEYESAAKFRDQILSIEKLSETQKVVSLEKKSDFDVVASAATATKACFAVLSFRGGLLVDKRHHIFPDVYDITEAQTEFLASGFDFANLSKEILTDVSPPDKALLEEYLTAYSGHRVSITTPKTGEKRRIVEMAKKNAIEQLDFSRGKSRGGLEELTEVLGMPASPTRIECIDITNTGADDIVAGLTVFVDGKPHKADYRKFNIESSGTPDDYGAVRNCLERRIKRFEEKDRGFENKPDLIFIDGGAGHVSAANEIVSKSVFCDVPLYGLVKNDKHRTRGIVGVNGEVSIREQTAAFSLIARIQDETHRFTIGAGRVRHKKSTLQLSLTKIDGIGEKRALKLMSHFKTKKALIAASAEIISAVLKVNTEKAEEISRIIKELLS